VPSPHGVKTAAPLRVCTKDKQDRIVRFMASEGMTGQRSTDNWLPTKDRNVCHNEVCTSGSKCFQISVVDTHW
jgi:hypothetical protein